MNLTLQVAAPGDVARAREGRHVFSSAGGTIGRSTERDWVLPHGKVSARHAVITCHDGVFYIEDKSSNGTFLNSPDNRLGKGRRYALKDGDRLYVGPYTIDVGLSGDREISARPPSSPPAYPPDPFGPEDPFGLGPPPMAEAPRSGHPPFDEPAAEGVVDPMALLGPGPARPRPPQEPDGAARLNQGSVTADHYGPPRVVAPPVPPDLPLRPEVPVRAPEVVSPPPASEIPEIPPGYDPLRDKFLTSFRVADPAAGSRTPATPGVADDSLFDLPLVVPPAASAPEQGPATPPAEPPQPQPFPPVGQEPPSVAATPSMAQPPAAPPLPPPSPFTADPGPVPAPEVDVPAVQHRPSAPEVVPPAVYQRPAPGPPSAPPGEDVLAAFLAGAGLAGVEPAPGLARTFGEILHVVVDGVIDVLQSRQEVKDEFRMRVTQLRPVNNNPLKFSVDLHDALHNLLVKRNPAYLGPVEAFEDAFDDLRSHQLAMLAGMRQAFESLLAAFDPAALEQEFDRQAKGVGLPRKLRYWDQYREWRERMAKDPDATFRHLFGEQFARAYEEQLARLKAERRARAGAAADAKAAGPGPEERG